MKVLIVLTSHDRLGKTGEMTGFWAEEFATPYYVLKDAGAEVALASPKGGHAPIDPKSQQSDAQTPATVRLFDDEDAMAQVATTLKLSEVNAEDFDAVYYPGGHGPVWDLAEDERSIDLIENFWRQGKPVAAVCHGPAALANAKTPDGEPIVKGRRATCLTNSEEKAAGLEHVVPFLVEDKLKEQGAKFERAADSEACVVVDGQLITGQNPASSRKLAAELKKKLTS